MRTPEGLAALPKRLKDGAIFLKDSFLPTDVDGEERRELIRSGVRFAAGYGVISTFPALLKFPLAQITESISVVNPENPPLPANGEISIPWGPFYYNRLSGYSLRDSNGFLAKLRQVSLKLGLPSGDPVATIDKYITDNGIDQDPAKYEIGDCPGVPRAAILGPQINTPITIAGINFSVFDRRGVALINYIAAAIKRDQMGRAIDYGRSSDPFTPREFHYLNMALHDEGIPYGMNTKEDKDLQPWWRPAYKTILENDGNLWRGWVELADYIYPGQTGTKKVTRDFEYILDPNDPADTGVWYTRDRIWAGFQVDTNPSRIDPKYAWQKESFNQTAAELVIGVKRFAPEFLYLYG